MDITLFFLSPLGWVFILSLLSMMFVSFRMVSGTSKHRSAVRRTLMKSAKKRAQRKVSVVVQLRRRANSLENLFEQLAAQHYKKLEVIVVVYHTAGKAAPQATRTLARRHNLVVKTISHKKGLTNEIAAIRRATGDIVMLLSADTRMSERFFEKLSLAFTQPVEAVRIHQLSQIGQSLISAFRALETVFSELIRAVVFDRPVVTKGLQYNIAVRLSVLKSSKSYQAPELLHDEYALTSSHQTKESTWRSAVALMSVCGVVALLLLTTPIDLLLYVGLILYIVLFVVMTVMLVQQVGLKRSEKMNLVLLIPFSLVAEVIALIIRTVLVIVRAIKIATPHQPARKKQPALQASTQ